MAFSWIPLLWIPLLVLLERHPEYAGYNGISVMLVLLRGKVVGAELLYSASCPCALAWLGAAQSLCCLRASEKRYLRWSNIGCLKITSKVLKGRIFSKIFSTSTQKRSGDPNPQYFPKVLPYKWGAYCTNGRRTAVQMGGVLQGFPFFEA